MPRWTGLIVWTLSLTLTLGIGLRFYLIRSLRRQVLRTRFRPQSYTHWGTGTGIGILGAFQLGTVLFGMHPIFGLAGLLLLPVGLSWTFGMLERRHAQCVDQAALRFFQALQGLTRTGLALPSACIQLTGSLDGAFSEALLRYTTRFRAGRISWTEALRLLQRKVPMRSSRLLLASAALSYQKGLPLLPLLEGVLPALEREMGLLEKAQAARKGALAQAAFAALLPWLLVGCLGVAFPNLEKGPQKATVWKICLIASLLWQGMGLALLLRWSRFYGKGASP